MSSNRESDVTKTQAHDSPSLVERDPSPVPRHIGRYLIRRILGQGGFGLVYLAQDESLDRLVAIKVPRRKLMESLKDSEEYLREARTVAHLDHVNIVPVYDVGATDEFPCYIVSKYIDGTDLAARVRLSPLTQRESCELIATVAEAAHHAHQQGLVHRDIKPGNILVDKFQKPFLADFGLALREEQYGTADPLVCGTPAYMSPEQARGEGHLVDGRSDIFSLGVVLYELLSDVSPFKRQTFTETLSAVVNQDPRPLRQKNDKIPRELERICLQALAKRALERYSTARDLADDLRNFLTKGDSELSEVRNSTVTRDSEFLVNVQDPRSGLSGGRTLSVVPKGLRAFDESDGDFYLGLLPGPCDREGLPQSLRFWKTRVEETSSQHPLRVGVVYGPSGCGKSSLIRAGLVPHIDASIHSIVITATAFTTEAQLLAELQPFLLRTASSLLDAMQLLRRMPIAKRRILIVIDQFEQWLHAHRASLESELVQALRQCDGEHLLCLLIARDDFWMSVHRLFRELDIPLAEGVNCAAVDLFDSRHARRVLHSFGHAYGALPERTDDLSTKQTEFLDQAIAELSEEDRVICVRLALFAQMVRNRPWEPETFRAIGGARGVGIRFLEDTFGTSSAPLSYRTHQSALREILLTLLPAPGTNIKACTRTAEELARAADCEPDSEAFQQMLRILEEETRLLTPVDVPVINGVQVDDISRQFQLTHDYLVPSIREWLTRKQRETLRGRSEILLEERTAIWVANPDNRHLPSSWEYLRIRMLTQSRNWGEPERRMMEKARRSQITQWSLKFSLSLILIAALIALRNTALQTQNRNRANELVNQLLVADISAVPKLSAQVSDKAALTTPLLERVADDPERTMAERFRATYSLADQPGQRASQLVEYAANSDIFALKAILQRVAPYANRLSPELCQAIQSTPNSSARLRWGALLALVDSNEKVSDQIPQMLVDALLVENTLDLDAWSELLSRMAPSLLPDLKDRFFARSATPTERVRAARILARFADPDLLCELLLSADATLFSTLFPATLRCRDQMINKARTTLQTQLGVTTEIDPIERARKIRNLGVLLLRLEQFKDVEPILKASTDPTARTLMMLEVRDYEISPDLLMDCLKEWEDPAARQAILLSLNAFENREFSPEQDRTLQSRLMALFHEGRSQSERSAAEWMLRHGRRSSSDASPNLLLAGVKLPSLESLKNRDWWVNTQGQTLCVVNGNHTRDQNPTPGQSVLENTVSPSEPANARYFGLSIHEVTIQQFLEFLPNADYARDVAKDLQCPANRVSFIQAMQYCRWLSEQEGVPDDQMCYPPISEITDGQEASIVPILSRTGYRLPIEEEWQLACSAGSNTRWPSGECEEQVGAFAWYALISDGHLWPVGKLKPNPLGFFDAIGNVAEWCHSDSADSKWMLRGGHYDLSARKIQTRARLLLSVKGYSFTGFRVARTLPTHD